MVVAIVCTGFCAHSSKTKLECAILAWVVKGDLVFMGANDRYEYDTIHTTLMALPTQILAVWGLPSVATAWPHVYSLKH